MITAHHLVFGRKYQGLFKINFLSSNRIRVGISTRNGNIIVKNLDGSIQNITTPKNTDLTLTFNTSIAPNYSSFYTGDLEVTTLSGNSDVYSVRLAYDSSNYPTYYGGRYNIQNIGDFWSQFPNLYSIYYGVYSYSNDSLRPTIKGNLFALPKSVVRVEIYNLDVLNRPNNTYGNFDSFTNDMQLLYFNDAEKVVSGGSKYYGDLAKTPPLVNFLRITATNNSTLTYTSGKVWASSFDTLDIGNATLSYTETDNLLIDMANSITTAIGSKIIRLANCYRTTASNTAVSYLQGLGFTITVLAIAIDTSTFLYSEISGVNTYLPLIQNGTVTFTTDRKGGNTAVQLGSGYLQTVNNLPSSNVWSVSFWLKKTNSGSTIRKIIFGFGTNTRHFSVTINVRQTNRLAFSTTNVADAQYNEKNIDLPLESWYHIVIVVDRAIVGHQNEIKFYVNGTLTPSVANTGSTDQTGDFISAKAQIGSFDGILGDIKIFNYQLNQTQITNLYNE